MPTPDTHNLDEDNLPSVEKAKRIAAESMAARRASVNETTTPSNDSEEGTPELSDSRRNAVISKVKEDMAKEATSINPTPSPGAELNTESVDVESPVSVENATDYNHDQHSVDNASENKDNFLDLPKPANTEGDDTINFLPGKSSAVTVKASTSQIIQLTDLYAEANLLDTKEAKWSMIAEFETLDKSFIEDRINLMTKVVAAITAKTEAAPQRVASVRPAPKVAGSNAPLFGRSTTSSAADLDSATDALLFLK